MPNSLIPNHFLSPDSKQPADHNRADSSFSKALSQQLPPGSATATTVADAAVDGPSDQNLIRVEAAENRTPGFAASNATTKTVFMSYFQENLGVLQEISEILAEIDPEITLAIFSGAYERGAEDAHEVRRAFSEGVGSNAIPLPTNGVDAGAIYSPIGRFTEDGFTALIYDMDGNPVAGGMSRDRVDRGFLAGPHGMFVPLRSQDMAQTAAASLDGLGFTGLDFLTYGGDFHVMDLSPTQGLSPQDHGGPSQVQFFGAETALLAHNQIFSNEDTIPEHLADLNQAQQRLYATAKVMEEIERISGSASGIFPLGAGTRTIGEVLATLPEGARNDISPGVLERLAEMSEYHIPWNFVGNEQINYHIDQVLTPLTNNTLIVNDSLRDDPTITKLENDPNLNIVYIPNKNESLSDGGEQVTSYINMLTIYDGETMHLVLPTESADRENLTAMDIEVRDQLEALENVVVHFTSFPARMIPGRMDYGLNCLTEISSLRIPR